MATADMTTSGHEHEDRTATIIINTRPHPWAERTISYEEVIALTYPGQPLVDGDEATVRFSRGHDERHSGTLTAQHSVKVKNRMVFDVYRTSRS